MTEDFISHYIKSFFSENDCMLSEKEKGIIEVTLSKEMDKAIMNRPFYWQFMETTNQEGVPMSVSLITKKDKRHEKGEWVTFGSPRLQQLHQHLKNQSTYTKLFQVIQTDKTTMLQPWLIVNTLVRYKGKQSKEEMTSIGLNLINGVMILDMMEQLSGIALDQSISDQCFTISPLIKIESGYSRIEKYIDNHVMEQDHQWAMESYELLQKELDMIHHFYQDNEASVLQQEIDAAAKRLAPEIIHETINGGIFYLAESFLNELMKKSSAI